MVVDSDVLIDFFRDFAKAREFLLNVQENLKISRVTVMEVVVGVKTKQAAQKAVRQLNGLGIEVVEINGDMSMLAGDVFVHLWPKHGLGILDSLVAATAMTLGEKLATRNQKHFKVVKGLDLIVPY